MTRLIPLLVAAATLFAEAILPAPALAQNVVSNQSCAVLVDGGAAQVATCGPFNTNLQPYGAVCEVTTVAGSVIANVQTQYSPNYGPDGGLFGAYDAGAVALNSISGVATPVATSNAPYNPWNGLQFVATVVAADGGTGLFTCQVGVIQAQTIHAARPKTKK